MALARSPGSEQLRPTAGQGGSAFQPGSAEPIFTAKSLLEGQVLVNRRPKLKHGGNETKLTAGAPGRLVLGSTTPLIPASEGKPPHLN